MRRLFIIPLVLLIYTIIMVVLGTVAMVTIINPTWSSVDLTELPTEMYSSLADDFWWWTGYISIYLVLIGLQIVFLLPIFSRRPPRETRGKSLTVSLLIGGVVAAALMFGLGCAVVEGIAIITQQQSDSDEMVHYWSIPLVMFLGGWVFWSVVLLLFSRGIWADRTLGRMVGVLLNATLLEMLVVLPLDIMVRRRTDCYCANGTYVTLCIAASVGLWLLGPGVMIALTSKRHRLWRETHCWRCGYLHGPTPGDRCPECGADWAEKRPGTCS